ncbi:MAG: hypothetical protein KGL39_45900 [Patescibacteria group bacterium]|nr:hypothetical protein [Patescibacteria group bacterium]
MPLTRRQMLAGLGASGLVARAHAFPMMLGGSSYKTTQQRLRKWNPGHYLQTDNRNGNSTGTGGNGRNHSEILYLATTGPGGAWSGSNVLGYQAYYNWHLLENTKNSYNFSAITSDFLDLQANCPGARFIPTLIFADYLYIPSVTATISGGVPSYILADPTTYGTGPNGYQGGYALANWDGTAWDLVTPMFWNNNVIARIEALYAALAATVIPDGLGYTFDTHPLIEGINDATELSLDYVSGGNPNSSYTSAGFYANYTSLNNAVPGYFPHTSFVPYTASYGLSPGSTTAINNLDSAITNDKTAGCSLSTSDVYGDITALTWGQHLYIGDAWNGTGWNTGAGNDRRGQMSYWACVQSPDYDRNTGGSTYTQAVQNIYNVSTSTLQASHILWCITSEVAGTGSAFFTSYVLPQINANPTINAPYPANYP